MHTAAPTGDFIGRARELGTLHAALEAARAGAAPMVVVHGEVGIGKTRTVAEFARAAAEEGAVVLWGTCYQGGLAYPYGPWVEAIGDYVERLEPARLAELLGPDAGVLAQLVPAIERILPDVAPVAALPPDQGRLRLYEVVVRVLDAIEGTPVLVLDDLQWADRDALQLLVHVARFATRPLIVALHRGAELDLEHPVTQRLAEVSRLRQSEYLLLSSLGHDDAAVLLERGAGRPVEPGLVEAIYAESGGNPFFIGELGRHLHQHGHVPTVGGWRPPETIRQAVALRLAGLSAEARHMLELAAVFTAGFGFDELAALTELDEGTLLDCLDEALNAELLRPVGAERYDFSHVLVRHTLYDGFSVSRRARLHRRLAEVLERVHEGAVHEVAAEIARQYHASAALPGAERGVRYALAAAEQARAAPAPEEAVAFLSMALELGPDDETTTIMGDLALAQAEASMLDEAPRTLDAALSRLQAGGADAETIARLVYQVVSVLQDALARQPTLEPLIARGIEAVGSARGLAWARLKLLERPCEVVPAGPIHAARWLGFDRDAVRIARARGSEADYARTIDHFAPWPLADVEGILPRIEAMRDPVARLRGLVVLTWNVTVTRWSGVVPPAERLCAEIDALGKELGSIPARAMASMFRAAVLGARGDFDAAAESLARAKPLVERLPPDHRVTVVAILIGELTAQHIDPDWQHLGDQMLHIGTRREQVPWFGLAWGAIAAHAYAQAGMAEKVRELLGHMMGAITSADPWDYAQNAAVSYAAEAIWELRDAELAEQLLPPALALVEARAGDYFMASNELTAARLTTLLGRFDEATEHFDRARQTVEERGQRPLQAIVDYDEGLARVWLQRAGATGLLAAGKTQFAALGMKEWSRRAAMQEAAGTPLPDGLTRREAEILRLVAAGETNKEIAATLVVSVHTVERHLQNAYRKISVRNRADATAYVLRHDL